MTYYIVEFNALTMQGGEPENMEIREDEYGRPPRDEGHAIRIALSQREPPLIMRTTTEADRGFKHHPGMTIAMLDVRCWKERDDAEAEAE
jgi:hypothetical protein